jgi:hypothetical protein
LLATSINHVETVDAPEGLDAPNSGMYGIELELPVEGVEGVEGVGVGCACANANWAGIASVAIRREMDFICHSWWVGTALSFWRSSSKAQCGDGNLVALIGHFF